ncbi:type I DNA topoisomerase [Telmatospirillum siberiense]|uniref:DNA topoisomerase 1 n=1 Tax=Telmatospirillum siberiense TaxID=382514 RepID=A0A2N3PM45_9PROT|nr:type I DNA topoisomerase [Telmatospirillum siberiense]PKU21473.1 type I DNA topoisomerase [Telmatospirillum siberiense]
MKIVVVESPAKAKTINKYLGSGYTVLASYGHIRDLPAKDGSVRPDDDFTMDWETDPKSEKHIRDIAQALKGAEGLILATDPDREGEAISWHVRRVLEERKALKGLDVKRVVFNEITKTAILEAMRNPRDLDQELVDAYLARRALDYLVGFTLSPVLWRKLPGSRSAGRVQSVALRLICEREGEIENFRAQEYWTVEADFLTTRKAQITAGLTRLDGAKLDKFDLKDEASAKMAEAKALAARYHIDTVERKQAKRHPSPPFTTSTLQQEASRKLYLPASRTMQVAQRLYEGIDIGGETVGLITYMRTDGVQMAAEAIGAARSLIEKQYGAAYLPSAPRIYKTKAKNAQEAHEAIRPTDVSRRPADVAAYLDREQMKLYELIWRRTVASQMESAILDQVAVDIVSEDAKIGFRATGSVVKFDGFLTLYREDRDDSEEDDGDKLLPDVAEGEAMERKDLRKLQHFTQPPPRYSEASLVKKLEELGIGRPSTYASIISVLQERSYVRLDARRFIPEDRGRVVTAFLENFFNRYVQYNFTAELEDQLDDVSGGRLEWKTVLRSFWQHFSAAVEDTRELRVSQVLDALDEALGPHFFPPDASGHDPRTCKTCNTGRLSLKLGKFGAFIGCSNYPECRYTRPLTMASNGDGPAEEALDGPKQLGTDPVSNLPVTLKKGPYGHYVQLGEAEEKGAKPKRVSLYKGLEPIDVTLDKALKLLALPRPIGTHPESGEPITAGIGKFGPYLKHGSIYKSLGRDDDVLEIGINRAVELLANAKGKTRTPGKTLGEHPDDGKPVVQNSGRFGPYVSHDGVYANLPKGKDDVTFEEALALLAAKVAKGGTKKGKTAKAAPKAKAKAPAKEKAEPAEKKAAVKKPAAKKPAAKKKAPAKPKATAKTTTKES